ncbi:MAG TPA: ATP-binding protein, partial [Puia sp.]|nr:ATP-binding protein [Puia sp.]
RNGYPEETYYTFSYTPIQGDNGGTAGMICFNTDDTDRIISERQLNTLTHLGKQLTDCQTAQDVIRRTIDTLRENPFDFPVAGFYVLAGDKASLAAGTGHPGTTGPTDEGTTVKRTAEGRNTVKSGYEGENTAESGQDEGNAAKSAHETGGSTGSILFSEIDLNGRHRIVAAVNQALQKKQPQIIDAAADFQGGLRGPWELPPSKIMVLPFSQSGEAEPYGLLVTGLNPYRLPDEKYSGFFSIIADQVTKSFGNVYVLEQERKRAQALAEIDQAKTTFFSNISHEFRTPLTLLLGPIEDALRDPEDVTQNRLRMDVAYRNALRMQKLVNTLLEFSRIEAGRLEGRFSRVDVCILTADLASSFRSAIEKAGMTLNLELEPVTAEVYVDPTMFEKIILNLVSNAFKYTSEGEIDVAVRERNGEVRISVRDTGIGIPEDQLDRIFDRFHRVENAAVRTQEGTGIGLSLVRELVKLHHGRIEVESHLGQGSTFTVVLPSGKIHLDPDRIVSPEAIALSKERNIYVEESLRWLPDARTAEYSPEWQAGRRHMVLLAEDNADMRDYVGRLLSGQYHVVTAKNGEEAFEMMQKAKPDLLLSDVMMPKLDGFGLLQRVRQHPGLRTIPVIMLSARAGEESKLEGLRAGADDYLVKP